jgi:hypothetical protein
MTSTTNYTSKPASATTVVTLTDSRFLYISTGTDFQGRLASIAQVSTVVNGVRTTAIFGDFRVPIERSDLRCTDANVRQQHERALQFEAQLVQRATQFYAPAQSTAPAAAPASSSGMAAGA